MPSREYGNNKGGKSRNRTGGKFIQIDAGVYTSTAWKHLSPNALAVYVYIMTLHNGVNNGQIGLSAQNAGLAINMSKSSGARALQELVDKGFLRVEVPSSFATNGRRAAEYRITAETLDDGARTKPMSFLNKHVILRSGRQNSFCNPSLRIFPSVKTETSRCHRWSKPMISTLDRLIAYHAWHCLTNHRR